MKHMQNFIHTPPETKTSMAESFDLSTNMGEKKKMKQNKPPSVGKPM